MLAAPPDRKRHKHQHIAQRPLTTARLFANRRAHGEKGKRFMCGIAGLWSEKLAPPQVAGLLEAMNGAIAHRGPDGAGVWQDPQRPGLGLAHRRLSIFDLSDNAAQPMASHSGQSVLSFNGEIYNFAALRAELLSRGVRLRSTGDTEVLLELLERDGPASVLPRLEGMFAFAWWDARGATLTLARDAYGKKPLLYHRTDDALAFASDLRALMPFPGVRDGGIDPVAARIFMGLRAVPDPFSILPTVRKLEPGHFMTLRRDPGGSLRGEAERWFSPDLSGVGLGGAALDAEFDRLFAQSVEMRLAADVPVGLFLSGGIDSSLVASEAQSQRDTPILSFTVGFDEPGYDESPYARAVAKKLGTDHHLLKLSEADIARRCLAMVDVYDEPFADHSAIPTHAVAELARKHATVVLTGDGGDETALGYVLHRQKQGTIGLLESVPAPLRAATAPLMRRSPWWREVLKAKDARHHYWNQRDGRFAMDAAALDRISGLLPAAQGRRSDAEWLGQCDLATYLVYDMLTKVDRATMAVGLEARSPLLDQQVSALIRRAPLADKIAGDQGKVVLRRALERRLPKSLFERRKAGFKAPIGRWLVQPDLFDIVSGRARAFDERFGWRNRAGQSAGELCSLAAKDPLPHGDSLWRVFQLMGWLEKHGF